MLNIINTKQVNVNNSIRQLLPVACDRLYNNSRIRRSLAFTNGHEIRPEDAELLFEELERQLRLLVEPVAERLSSVEWLWYLRRIDFSSILPASERRVDVSADLAEELTSITSRGRSRASREERTRLVFEWSDSACKAIVELLAISLLLRKAQRSRRTAGKGVRFFATPGTMPIPRPSEAQSAAMQYYDRRSYYLPLIGRTGANIFGSSLIVNLQREPQGFSVNYLPTPDLRAFDVLHLSERRRNTAARALLLAMIATEVLLSNQEHEMGVTRPFGYIFQWHNQFINMNSASFDRKAQLIKELIPNAKIPQRLDSVLQLSTRPFESWPANVASMVRRCDNAVVLDLYSVSKTLDSALTFGRTEGKAGNERGNSFPKLVQALIDNTGCAPVTALDRALIGKKLKSDSNQVITDIDAIAVLGTELLIVECKSRYLRETTAGMRFEAREQEQQVERALQLSMLLTKCPKQGNFDLSRFSNIKIVVCSNRAVYAESSFIGRAAPTGLLSKVEVFPGLTLGTHLAELLGWLECFGQTQSH